MWQVQSTHVVKQEQEKQYNAVSRNTVGFRGVFRALVLPHSCSHTVTWKNSSLMILMYWNTEQIHCIVNYFGIQVCAKNVIWKQLEMHTNLGKQSSLSPPQEAEMEGVTQGRLVTSMETLGSLTFQCEHYNKLSYHNFSIERRMLCSTRRN